MIAKHVADPPREVSAAQVAVQCLGVYMQTSDLVIGLWDDGSAAVGKHFTEGPVEVTVTPARTA